MALLVAPVPLSALTAVQADGAPARVVVRLSAYFEPADPWRLKVELVRAADVLQQQHEQHEQQEGNGGKAQPGLTPALPPALACLSINLEAMPNPGPRAFFFKTWAENQGLLDALVGAGVVRVLNPAGVPVGMVKAVECELAWPDTDVQVCLDVDEQKLQDWQRFFSHTCIQHLGL